MSEKLRFTAILLAGGKSTRMGQDKAFLRFGEKSMVEHLTELLSSFFDETLVIVHDQEKFEMLDLRSAELYEDLIRNRGPLAAIYTGLFYSNHKASVVFTCDMPFVDAALIEQLTDFWEEDLDALSVEDPTGQSHPFPGIYTRSSRHLMRLLIHNGEASMRRFFEVAVVKKLALEEKRIHVLTNMNRIEDYFYVLKVKNEEKIC